MSDIILKAQNISKQYRLGLIGTGTISHDLNRWWHKVRGKDDPYLTVGAVNDRSAKAIEDYVWALQDINFEVKKGEVLGIIGKNGAGKSTLLKILSRVTSPTTGEIKTKGRIASLLEVGTGFHPEMTGRENIFLNGAILGMTKKEIKAKEEEIIEFSGCELYIDTPVKRYSSGMRVRLAFAVAAHLEPDILVIDEVLAVGDAEFQKKAIGKMQDISQSQGRTVLFVSHNMAAVKSLCTRAIVLEDGKMTFEGETDAAVDFYLQKKENLVHIDLKSRKDRTGTGKILFSKVELYNQNNKKVNSVISGEFLRIKIFFEIKKDIEKKLIIGISFKDINENIKALIVSDEMKVNINDIVKKGFINIDFNEFLLRGGIYHLTMIFSENNTYEYNHIDRIDDAFVLDVLGGDIYKTGKLNRVKSSSILKANIN
jgi:homopolymeric O-antigen transport system ATP-binding protein